MLSKDQYTVLGFLYSEKEICIFNNPSKEITLLIDQSDSLMRNDFIVGRSTTSGETLDTFSITEKGKAVWETYAENLKKEKFNRKLSIAAFIISVIAVIVSVAGIIVHAVI